MENCNRNCKPPGKPPFSFKAVRSSNNDITCISCQLEVNRRVIIYPFLRLQNYLVLFSEAVFVQLPMLFSSIGSRVETDLWRKDHSAYPKERNTYVINSDADFLCDYPSPQI